MSEWTLLESQLRNGLHDTIEMIKVRYPERDTSRLDSLLFRRITEWIGENKDLTDPSEKWISRLPSFLDFSCVLGFDVTISLYETHSLNTLFDHNRLFGAFYQTLDHMRIITKPQWPTDSLEMLLACEHEIIKKGFVGSSSTDELTTRLLPVSLEGQNILVEGGPPIPYAIHYNLLDSNFFSGLSEIRRKLFILRKRFLKSLEKQLDEELILNGFRNAYDVARIQPEEALFVLHLEMLEDLVGPFTEVRISGLRPVLTLAADLYAVCKSRCLSRFEALERASGFEILPENRLFSPLPYQSLIRIIKVLGNNYTAYMADIQDISKTITATREFLNAELTGICPVLSCQPISGGLGGRFYSIDRSKRLLIWNQQQHILTKKQMEIVLALDEATRFHSGVVSYEEMRQKYRVSGGDIMEYFKGERGRLVVTLTKKTPRPNRDSFIVKNSLEKNYRLNLESSILDQVSS